MAIASPAGIILSTKPALTFAAAAKVNNQCIVVVSCLNYSNTLCTQQHCSPALLLMLKEVDSNSCEGLHIRYTYRTGGLSAGSLFKGITLWTIKVGLQCNQVSATIRQQTVLTISMAIHLGRSLQPLVLLQHADSAAVAAPG